MRRWFILAFALASYVLFLVTIGYAVAFLGNLFVDRTIDAAARVPLREALMVNIGLLLIFAVQHSGMARVPFKLWLSRWLPRELVRSTFVLASSMTFIAVMLFWQPMGGVVWVTDSELLRRLVTGIYLLGWGLMVWSTFLIDHFELFGLRQAWCVFRRGGACVEPPFCTPAAYRFVRHPIYAGWLIVMWASPAMTATHLVLALGMTAYVVVGIRLEERDLAKRLPYYEQYRRKVPMLLPSWNKRLSESTEP